MTNIPQWIVDEVADGLAALMALRLRNAPAEDTIDLTADIWEQAFVRRMGVTAQELDAPRIAEGFRRLFPTVTEWPAPAQVLGLMPGRPEQKRLAAPDPVTESAEEVRALVSGLLKEMNIRDMLKKQTGANNEATPKQ